MKIAAVCRMGLAGVLIAAGGMKMSDMQEFAYDVHLFDLTSWAFSRALAFYLPGFEILVAIALFIPRLRLGALFAVLGLGFTFSVAIASAWIRGLDLSCGCFGHTEQFSNYPLHLIGTLAIFGVSVWLICRERVFSPGIIKFCR